ncbi:MAG: ribosome maturation factor RimP [Deltaproteobacteria bacterium]|nr:ribosome maturation factor RimP [Deltaproteobacteria bacterium]
MSGAEEKRIEEIFTGWLTAHNYELVDLKLFRGKGKGMLKILIDREGGVGIDDCAFVSRHLSLLLDAEDPIPGSYNFEVSSPGIDRPLKGERDFRRFAGGEAKVKTLQPVEGRTYFEGTIGDCAGGGFKIHCREGDFTIGFDNVSKANLIGKKRW